MVLRTKEEALYALRESLRDTGEPHCLVYTGHGVIELRKEADCEGYEVVLNSNFIDYSENSETTYNNQPFNEKLCS